MKKVLWFSRHNMSEDQAQDLKRIYGDVTINQVSKTINSAYELQDDINNSDVIAIVAPVNLQQQFLKLAEGKPVISARSKRLVDLNDDTKFIFVFDGWYQILEVKVVTQDL